MKPLTKEERALIAAQTYPAYVEYDPENPGLKIAELSQLVSAAAKAEAYWREAVKNATHGVFNEEAQDRICLFSAGIRRESECTDCPWLIANAEN